MVLGTTSNSQFNNKRKQRPSSSESVCSNITTTSGSTRNQRSMMTDTVSEATFPLAEMGGSERKGELPRLVLVGAGFANVRSVGQLV